MLLKLSLIFMTSLSFSFAKPLAAEATAKPTLTWAFSSFNGIPASARKFLIQENSYFVRQLIAGLPEYNHKFLHGNVLRIEHELKAHNRTCYPASSTLEERKAYTYLTSE